MAEKRKIIWNLSAASDFEKILKWVEKRSVQGSEIIEQNIFIKLEQALINPLRFPQDQYKVGNSGEFRCFLSYRYRVTYQVRKTEIRVVRIIHARQKPTIF